MPDQALKTARQILRRVVCECGCTCSEHAGNEREPARLRPCCECDCERFRPVRFTVERAS